MIYAIQAVGTEYIKFGRASSVGRRMREIETHCPHELEVLATADWPDGQEKSVHSYLRSSGHKLEWFRASPEARQVIAWMQDKDAGLKQLINAVVGLRPERAWRYTYKRDEKLHLNHQPSARRRAERQRWWEENGR